MVHTRGCRIEKTFEELIAEKSYSFKDEQGFGFTGLIESDVLELLKQVREATIAECAKIYDADWGKYVGYKKMLELPTDRITITENEE